MTLPASPDEFTTTAIVSSGRVRSSGASSPVTIPVPHGCDTPSIHVVQQAGAIQAIEITCNCGQQIRLVCDYEP